MKITYANESVKNFGIGYPTTYFYQFICDENENFESKNKIFYYTWTGIMHQGRQLCGAYVICMVIQS